MNEHTVNESTHDADVAVEISLVRNSILSLVAERGTQKLLRVLGFDEENVSLIVIGLQRTTVGPSGSEKNIFTSLKAPKKVRSRLVWSRKTVDKMLGDGTLMRESEVGRPAWMDKSAFPSKADLALEKRRRAVSIVEKGGDFILWDAGAYTRSISIAARRCNVGVAKVRRWYETYLFFGRHVNGLVPRNDLKGGPGSSRAHIKGPLGARTKVEKSFPNTKHKRTRVTIHQKKALEKYIEEQAWETNDPFKIIFPRFLRTQIASNRCPEGLLRFYPADMKNFPETENVRRLGRRMLKKHRFARDESRLDKPGKRQLRGGSAQALVHDLVPVWDIDATPADNYILFGDDLININGVTKPTVVIAVDRASNAITGWDVTYTPENGGAYLNCILSGYTPKEREMARWKVPYLRGLVYGPTSKIFIDRGPGSSKKTTDACNNLQLHSLIAQPGDGSGKGHGECVMRYVQEALAYLTGSTYTTGDPVEDRKRQMNAKKGAVTMEVYMQALLMAISKRNLETDASKLLTVFMTKEKVLACPAEIFRYNKGRRRGDAAWDWAPEDILKKLCVKHSLQVVDGRVTLYKRAFSSTELKFHARYHGAVNTSPFFIDAYQYPNAPFLLLWEWPNGRLGMLDATDEVIATYEDGFAFSVDIQNIYKQHLLLEAKLMSKKDAHRVRVEMNTMSKQDVSLRVQKQIALVEQHTASVVRTNGDYKASKVEAEKKLAAGKVCSVVDEINNRPSDEVTGRTVVDAPLWVINSFPEVGQHHLDDEKDIFIDY